MSKADEWWEPYRRAKPGTWDYWGVIEQRAAEIVSHAERLKNNNADITGAPRRHMTLAELEGWCISLHNDVDKLPQCNEHWAGWLAHVIWTTDPDAEAEDDYDPPGLQEPCWQCDLDIGHICYAGIRGAKWGNG